MNYYHQILIYVCFIIPLSLSFFFNLFFFIFLDVNISVLTTFTLNLSNIIEIYNNIDKGIDEDKLKNLSYHIDSFFNSTIKGLYGTKTIEWSSEKGILSFINNKSILNILSFIILSSLQHLHNSASIRIDWKPSRFDKKYNNLFINEWMKNIKCLTLSNEYGILILLIETLLRYHKLDPNNPNILLSLGDSYHFIEKYNYSIKYYLMAGNIDSEFFTDFVIPDSITKSIHKLISSFIGLKRFDIASILKQFILTKEKYSDLYNLVFQYGLYFKESYFEYLYEIPIIELLISM